MATKALLSSRRRRRSARMRCAYGLSIRFWYVYSKMGTFVIPADTDPELNQAQIDSLKSQESGSGMSTTDGYTMDESGRMDNYAVEPKAKKPRI
ncbi:MAG: hypothetical protein AAFQ14_18585 [Cyanobacteria bacterium J06621_12]